jgi:Tol biopolymer transport system component
MVELSSGTITSATRRTAHFDVRVSNRGDRLAWVDYMTGTNESIVIADLESKQLRRLTLPTGAWQSELSWSPDDTTLAVATHLPLQSAQASHIRLASIIACCSIDRGVQATHLLSVPVDGSPIRDLFDDGAKVAQDQAEPFPTPPPDAKTPGFPAHGERWLEPGEWSPDGGTVLLTTRVCSATWNIASTHVRRTCASTLSTVDVETAKETVVTSKMPSVASARWSPDGRRILFVGGRVDSEDGLFVIDRDGANRTWLTDATGTGVWSPDGAWIAFQRFIPNDVEEHYHLSVWVMPADGGVARWVADHATAGW